MDPDDLDQALAGRENRRRRIYQTALRADEATLKTLRGLGQIQATSRETAAVLGVSEPTLFNFFKRSPEAHDAWERAKEGGKASLRRKQIAVALGEDGKTPNPAMLIWLGKQYLGQREPNVTIGGTGPGGSVPIVNVTPEMLEALSDEALAGLTTALTQAAIAAGTVIEHEAVVAQEADDDPDGGAATAGDPDGSPGGGTSGG